ncbi:MAG: nuclear transport factor 2 family protein [Shinella sp.]|nr:nuclear transport factor 2 family protein [Shinella sp.]
MISASPASASPAEEAKIAGVISAVAVYADNRDFAPLQRFFASQTLIDYTSLWGGEAQRFTPEALMAAWAGLLPGFDATRHQLSAIEVNIDRNEAHAKADVTASHWIGSDSWVVSGSYDFEFMRSGVRWQVTSMTFHLAEEAGDRGLVAKAAERAARAK